MSKKTILYMGILLGFLLISCTTQSTTQTPALDEVVVETAVVEPTATASKSPKQAIDDIRAILQIPPSRLEFVEQTFSPNANETVATYKDEEERYYSVSTERNQVVEINVRGLIPVDTATEANPNLDALRDHAKAIAIAAYPELLSNEANMIYEEGSKGDRYFFVWKDKEFPLQFLQVAFLQDGQLFAYYNTLR